MGITCYPLPQSNGNLPLPFFGGNYPFLILNNIDELFYMYNNCFTWVIFFMIVYEVHSTIISQVLRFRILQETRANKN